MAYKNVINISILQYKHVETMQECYKCKHDTMK